MNHFPNFVFCFLIFFVTSSHCQVILIDPGHGGDDKGAEKVIKTANGQSNVYFEKTIALEISKKIQDKLIKLGRSAYLTRSYDRFVSLQERADMANKLKADLFISVHVNSDAGSEAEGFETYYLDNHKDIAVRKVESVENKELIGDDKVVNQILIDLVIERTAPLSHAIASLIHQNLRLRAQGQHQMKDRGVKAGLLYVLALSKRPAILLEVGFISNAKDLTLMLNDSFQNQTADAVATGVDAYFRKKK